MKYNKYKFRNNVLKIIDTGFKDAAWNIAMDQVLLELAHIHGPFLRFLSFQPECVLIGYFQSLSQEVRLNYCQKEGIDIGRRITGGGAIYFDPSQIGWEFIGRIRDFPYSNRELSYIFGNAISYALSKLGIRAEFRERNDIEVKGKKISGMGGVVYEGNFLFQGTLLTEDKIERMLKSLKVPIEKLKPKEIDSVRERVTCIEHELGYVPEREKLKDILISGISEYLKVKVVYADLPEEARKRHAEILPYYRSNRWINKIVLPEKEQDVLTGYFRTKNGTIKVSVTVNIYQKMIRNTLITGDFFANPKESIYKIESLLKNIRFDLSVIEEIIFNFFEKNRIDGITAQDLYSAVQEVFKKWQLIESGFSPRETNEIFLVNIDNLKHFNPSVFLLPYCSKDTQCAFRYKNDCTICGMCTIGDAYYLSYEYGLEPITITSFEDLISTFKKLKKRGIYEYIGSCCEAFYIKHQEEFFKSGLKGLLINIENTTCYDLDKAKEAYAGKFESQTTLNLKLIKKTLDIIYEKNIKGAKK